MLMASMLSGVEKRETALIHLALLLEAHHQRRGFIQHQKAKQLAALQALHSPSHHLHHGYRLHHRNRRGPPAPQTREKGQTDTCKARLEASRGHQQSRPQTSWRRECMRATILMITIYSIVHLSLLTSRSCSSLAGLKSTELPAQTATSSSVMCVACPPGFVVL